MFFQACLLGIFAVAAGNYCCLNDPIYEFDEWFFGTKPDLTIEELLKFSVNASKHEEEMAAMDVWTLLNRTHLERKRAVLDFSKRLGYYIDEAHRHCIIFHIGPYHPLCVPDAFKPFLRSYLGSGRNRLPVTVSRVVHESRFLTIDDHCVPVSLFSVDGAMSDVAEFMNFHNYISNQSVFTIPDYCHPHRLFHALPSSSSEAQGMLDKLLPFFKFF